MNNALRNCSAVKSGLKLKYSTDCRIKKTAHKGYTKYVMLICNADMNMSDHSTFLREHGNISLVPGSGPAYAGISFIQNHPPRDKPPGHDLKGAITLPLDSHCVQKPSPRDRTGSQKPHPRDIKLENFTNISINSDTI